MRKFPISSISLCANFGFILNTLHCDAYQRDSVVKFQTQPHLLQKLDYC